MSGQSRAPTSPHPGLALSSAALEKMRRDNVSTVEFAACIGRSASYVNSLLRNGREWSSLCASSKRNIAEFLGTSYVNVLMLAGEIQPEDFIRTSGLNENLDAVFRAIAADKKYGVFLKGKSDWDGLPDSIKIFIALLYEKCNGIEILEKARMIKIKVADDRSRHSG